MKIKIFITVSFLCLIAGCEREPAGNLTVTTGDIEIFAGDTYILNGSVAGSYGTEITEHGFCWSESENPVIDEKSVHLGVRSSDGDFSCILAGFSTSTTYYVKAFAIAGTSTYYGEVKSFTTPEKFPLVVIDIDKNIYSAVEIGSQVWMAENLKAVRYSDGTAIPRVEDQKAWFDFTMYSSAYCWYENYSATGAAYGALYTWPAANRVSSADEVISGKVQGVCPDGWHLPSDDEWKQLEMYLGMSLPESGMEDWRGTDEGGKIKSEGILQWQSPNTGATDEISFGALPAGWRDGSGYFKNLGKGTKFWSSSLRGDYAWMRELSYNSAQIYRGTKGLYEGISVRCVKDN